MRWVSALILGAILGFILPLAFGGQDGLWLNSWAGAGTIRPSETSPGLLFSIPVAAVGAIAARLFFNWHRN
ncbi:hypothetical protein ABDK56_04995 [Sphingomonas sp. ASV193]|uniref:hypothetical protein n=1 Tax=Sphingomonas sp. ASV193 TaxID=3144405 RepID=UPI0032E8BB60